MKDLQQEKLKAVVVIHRCVTMSKYTNYDVISQTYDDGRFASGVDKMTYILAGMLKKKVEEIHMLDAGCGTGNYCLGFLENGIGKLAMMDASDGMLQRAKKKVEKYSDRITAIKQNELPTLPFPSESFDVITLTQVIHHLDTHHLGTDETPLKRDQRYPNLRSTIKEAYRVLKPHGVLLIDHCFSTNIDGSWLSLTPKALEMYKAAFIPEDDLIEMIREENYKDIFYISRPENTCLKKDVFYDPELVLDKNWRCHASEWSFPEKTGELPALIQLIEKKKEEGKLSEFTYETNKLFRRVGLTTMLFAQKELLS